MDGMQPNLHRQHWKRTKSSLCLMNAQHFKVTAGHESKLPPWNGLGGSGEGVLFSLKRLMYFHCYLTLLDR